jgi:dihydrodipicolinate synthase/N-acetylneuraminate lyase
MSSLLLAASVTPLRDGGARVDEDAIEPLARFLVDSGADGAFALGTTGEGVLLGLDERRTVAKRFREARAGMLIVHCGAQSTADTVALAGHAAAIGADGVAVIPPPYYPLGDDALVGHFAAAAAACAPTPFYLYAFAARSGYPLPVDVIQRVRERSDNVAGLKVSEAPFERVAPYLELGLPVFVGAERLIPEALAAGAAGAVSGLASAFPDVVAAVVRRPDAAGGARLNELRSALEQQPFQAALKQVLHARGVPIRADVRAPLAALTPEQAEAVDALAARASDGSGVA